MAVSEPLPKITLIGGDGGNSGVPRHMFHLVDSFQGVAKVTLISDHNRGGFEGTSQRGAQHVTIRGLQTQRSLRHLWKGWRGLTQHLRASDADLIWLHARMPVLMGRLALALKVWKPKSPVAVTFHGLPFGPGHKPRSSMISKGLEKLLLSLCPSLDLIFLSQSMADDMVQTMGARRMAKHRIHVLPNCSNLGPLLASVPDTETAARLVMTGRVGWQKNYELAAQVFAHLPNDYTLTLCGAGTESLRFQGEIRSSVSDDVARRIHFAGPLQDVGPALMAADCFMLCSRYEGLPIGALEAFEAGLPVVLSNFKGAAELAASSPYASVLDFDDLAWDAQQIVTLVTAYRRSTQDPRAEIKKQWRATWSPQVFKANSQALLQKLLR